MLRFFKQNKASHSDLELLHRYQTHDDLEALGQLFDRYMELVFGLCLKILKDEMKAEDAVMGIFEELVKKLKTSEVTYFKSWLYMVSKNFCLMQLRREKKDLTSSYDPAFMQFLEKGHLNGEPKDDETFVVLEDCIKKLSDRQKLCIHMFYYEGKSYKEIAQLQELAVDKVRSNIQNGRRNLKNCIEGDRRTVDS